MNETEKGRALGLSDTEIMYIVDYAENIADATACQKAIDKLDEWKNKAPLNALVDAYAMYYHVAQQALEALEKLGRTQTEVMLLAYKIMNNSK